MLNVHQPYVVSGKMNDVSKVHVLFETILKLKDIFKQCTVGKYSQ